VQTLVFISADAAKEKEKREKVLLPAGVSKSAAYTVVLRASSDQRVGSIIFQNCVVLLMDALLTKNLLVFNLVHGLYYPTTIELTN
jgi:hypothetical protein